MLLTPPILHILSKPYQVSHPSSISIYKIALPVTFPPSKLGDQRKDEEDKIQDTFPPGP